jgi:hypothetical protein
MIFMFRRMVFKYSVADGKDVLVDGSTNVLSQVKCILYFIHFRVNKKCIRTVAVVVDKSTTGTRQII